MTAKNNGTCLNVIILLTHLTTLTNTFREGQEQYYQDSKEQIDEYQRQYYSDNKEQINERNRQYRQENKEQIDE